MISFLVYLASCSCLERDTRVQTAEYLQSHFHIESIREDDYQYVIKRLVNNLFSKDWNERIGSSFGLAAMLQDYIGTLLHSKGKVDFNLCNNVVETFSVDVAFNENLQLCKQPLRTEIQNSENVLEYKGDFKMQDIENLLLELLNNICSPYWHKRHSCVVFFLQVFATAKIIKPHDTAFIDKLLSQTLRLLINELFLDYISFVAVYPVRDPAAKLLSTLTLFLNETQKQRVQSVISLLWVSEKSNLNKKTSYLKILYYISNNNHGFYKHYLSAGFEKNFSSYLQSYDYEASEEITQLIVIVLRSIVKHEKLVKVLPNLLERKRLLCICQEFVNECIVSENIPLCYESFDLFNDILGTLDFESNMLLDQAFVSKIFSIENVLLSEKMFQSCQIGNFKLSLRVLLKLVQQKLSNIVFENISERIRDSFTPANYATELVYILALKIVNRDRYDTKNNLISLWRNHGITNVTQSQILESLSLSKQVTDSSQVELCTCLLSSFSSNASSMKSVHRLTFPSGLKASSVESLILRLLNKFYGDTAVLERGEISLQTLELVTRILQENIEADFLNVCLLRLCIWLFFDLIHKGPVSSGRNSALKKLILILKDTESSLMKALLEIIRELSHTFMLRKALFDLIFDTVFNGTKVIVKLENISNTSDFEKTLNLIFQEGERNSRYSVLEYFRLTEASLLLFGEGLSYTYLAMILIKIIISIKVAEISPNALALERFATSYRPCLINSSSLVDIIVFVLQNKTLFDCNENFTHKKSNELLLVAIKLLEDQTVLALHGLRVLIPLVRLFSNHLLSSEVKTLLSNVLSKIFTLEQAKLVGRESDHDLTAKNTESKEFIYALLNGDLKSFFINSFPNITLRDYQKEAVAWLIFLEKYNLNGMLCDDLGLGKTLMSLYLIASTRKSISPKVSLVISPATLLAQWQEETKKWFNDELKSDVFITVIISKDNLHKLKVIIQQIPVDKHLLIFLSFANVSKLHRELNEPQFHYIVVDEAHRIRNRKTKAYKSVSSLCRRNKRLLFLTGTPFRTNVSDVFSYFDILLPSLFVSDDSFKKDFSKHINAYKSDFIDFFSNVHLDSGEKAAEFEVMKHLNETKMSDVFETIQNSQIVALAQRENLNKKFARKRAKMEAANKAITLLKGKILPFILRRLKTDVLKELPKKINHTVVVKLSKTQSNLYHEVQKLASTPPFMGKGTLHDLLNICNHPTLFNAKYKKDKFSKFGMLAVKNKIKDYITDSSKFVALLDLLNDVLTKRTEEKLIIFVQQVKLIRLLCDHLLDNTDYDYVYLDGTVPIEERAAKISTFKSGSSNILLATTRIGGVGLNLTEASTIILFEHSFDPFVDIQVIFLIMFIFRP